MDSETAKKEIGDRLKVLLELASKRDAEAAIKFYTEDAVFMHDGHPTRKGKKDILLHLKRYLPYGKTFASVSFEVFELTSDNAGFIKCHISIADEQGKILSTEHSSHLWKKIDGEWLIDRDMFAFVKSDELQYEGYVRKEIRIKSDISFGSINKDDIDTATTVYAEDIKVSVPMHETVVGKAALRELMMEKVDEWKILKYKQIYFELLNNDTVYLNNDVDSIDEKTGKIKKSYRDTQIWKKKSNAGWFMQVLIINEEPEH